MSTLIYLNACKMKNKLCEILRKPLRLIAVVGFAFLLIMNFSISLETEPGTGQIYEFYAIVYAFYILCFAVEVNKGFSSGGTMFSIADVNLLFVSPIKSAKVLFYGMLSRLGTSLWMGFAFVYQFALLRSYYPLTVIDMLVSVTGYGTVVFLSQFVGMLIYFFTCSDKRRHKTAKSFLYAVYAIFAIIFAVGVFFTQEVSLASVVQRFTASYMKAFPVAGWVFMAVEGILKGKISAAVTGILLCGFLVITGFVILTLSKHSYYENVLLTAEKSRDKKSDFVGSSYVEIKKDEKGLNKGRGASVFFYKHLLENRRTKTTLLSPSSLFYLVFIGVYGFVFKSDFIVLFSLSCTVSFMPVLSGRWLKELSMPYIYMIPESALKKLFYLLPEMLPKIVIESVLQCALIGLIFRMNLLMIIFITLSRISVCMVFLSTSLTVARLFREREKNAVFAAATLLPGAVLVIPSVVCCLTAISFGSGLAVGFLIMTAVNIFVSAVLMFFAKNLIKFQ